MGHRVEGLRCKAGIVFEEICQDLPPKKDKYLGEMKVNRWVLLSVKMKEIQRLERTGAMKEEERENEKEQRRSELKKLENMMVSLLVVRLER